MDEGDYQPHQLSQTKLGIVYHIYKVYPFWVVTGSCDPVTHRYPLKIDRGIKHASADCICCLQFSNKLLCTSWILVSALI